MVAKGDAWPVYKTGCRDCRHKTLAVATERILQNKDREPHNRSPGSGLEKKPDQNKSQNNPTCRMCKREDKSVMHILSGCIKLEQEEYKKRHDNMGKAVHWDLRRAKGFEHAERWYEHSPDSEDWNILRDLTRSAGASQAKKGAKKLISPYHKMLELSRAKVRSLKSARIYQGKSGGFARQVKAKVISFVVGTLGIQANLEEIGVHVGIDLLQKSFSSLYGNNFEKGP